jgi:predicted nucleic acid-binding protein
VILVDTSVWIDYLRDNPTNEARTLDQLIDRVPILVGDLVLCELLQGFRSDQEAKLVEDALRRFDFVSLVTPDLAIRAATNYRFLRGKGVTIRKTIDFLIATFCIENSHTLLHADRDFDPFRTHLGLQVV